MSKKIFITGFSALASTGHSIDDIWTALLNGESGIAEMAELAEVPWKLAGEIKDFQAAKMLPDRKLTKVISKQDAYGIFAATKAVEHSNMIQFRDTLSEAEQKIFNEKTAVFVGSPGNKYIQQYDFLPLLAKSQGDMKVFGKELFEAVHPMWLLRILPNNVLAYTGITYGFKGPNHNISNHAVGGSQALLEAWHALRNGQAQRAVVIAYDLGPEPQGQYYYDKLGVLSHKALKPFDADRDGTILAEGAVALILETEESVKKRSGLCHAELLGAAAITENQSLFSLEKEGKVLGRLLQTLLEQSKVKAEDIDMLVAHGNGNAVSEDSESLAIKAVFGAYPVPVTAFKWSFGHTLCASGLMDTVLACLAMKEGIIPGIANLNKPVKNAADLNLSSQSRTMKKEASSLIINRGFASMNAAILVRNCV